MLQLFLIAAGLSGIVAAPSTEVVEARPSGRWVVEFADTACQASQPFAIAGKQGALALSPRPTTEIYNLFLLVPRDVGGFDSAEVLVGGTAIEAKGMTSKRSPRAGQRLYEVQLTGTEYSKLLASADLRVRTGNGTFRFAPSGLPKVQRTLDGCVADLLESWGVSKQAQAELASFPKADIETSGYISAEDYPTSALDAGASGDVQVRLTVGTDGRPNRCAVLQSAGHGALDATTCNILVKRARFTPARNKQGDPMEGPFITTIRWRIY